MGSIKGLVETDKVLRMFSERPSEARKLYKDFVDIAIGIKSDGSIYKAVGQQIIGDEKFIEKVAEEVDNLDSRVRKPQLKEIFAAVEEATGVSQGQITSRGRGEAVKLARMIFLGACRESGYRLVELQTELKRDLSVLSRWSKSSENKEERKIVQKVLRKFNA